MRSSRGLALALALATPAVAVATPLTAPSAMTVEGEVVATTSRWTSDGSRIVTEATVRTATGDVVVSQLGGTVDGLTMRSFPGPALLVPGMRVAVAAHRDRDLSQREHVVVDRVRVLAHPPSYVRTGPTKSGNYLYWESGCVFIHADADGTRQLPGALEFEVIEQAIEEWNSQIEGCSYLELRYAGRIEAEVGRDAINLIKFRDVSWCRPAVGDDPPRCHAQTAAGITTATYVDDATSPRDGAIVDADIELNGTGIFAIASDGSTIGTGTCLAELANTLTHELGHLLGIEHPCRTPTDPDRVDDQGQPVPLCSMVSDPEITESTMFNFQDCGETKKATLESEDIAAACGIYPRADDPGSCDPVDLTPAGCCSTSGEPVSTLIAGGLTLIVLARRRRPRGGR